MPTAENENVPLGAGVKVAVTSVNRGRTGKKGGRIGVGRTTPWEGDCTMGDNSTDPAREAGAGAVVGARIVTGRRRLVKIVQGSVTGKRRSVELTSSRGSGRDLGLGPGLDLDRGRDLGRDLSRDLNRGHPRAQTLRGAVTAAVTAAAAVAAVTTGAVN